jgi:HEPN domain-containing protein
MNEPLDRQVVVREWLSIADDDLQSAKALMEGCHWRQACFLSQQATEKYLKALLTSRQIPFEHTHDLENLAALLADAKPLGLLRPDVLDLSEYAIDARYPGMDANLIGKDDASRALAASAHVAQSIHKALGL